MYSIGILPEPDPNKIPLSDADDIGVGEVAIPRLRIPVDPDPTLLEQTPQLAGAFRDAGFEDRRGQVGPARPELRDLARQLPLPEAPVPLRIGRGCGLRSLEALDKT